MKTFTNYAEKKAKQFLNLLQGYTKGIRITAILILLLMGVSSAWAEKIYFKPWSSWKSDARLAAYFYGSGTESWSSFKQIGSSEYYVCDIPSGSYTHVIFYRMNPSATANNWNNKYNQSAGDKKIALKSNALYKQPTSNNPWDNWTCTGSELTWYIAGGFNEWSTTSNKLPCTIALDANNGYTFKLVASEVWLGNNGTMTREYHEGWEMAQSEDCTLSTDIAGNYQFSFDTKTAKLTVTYPEECYLKGDFNDWGNTSSLMSGSTTINLKAKTTYKFKIHNYGATSESWHGNTGTMTRDNCSGWKMDNATDCQITTDVAGDYTFTYERSTQKLSVTYPTAYTVTYSRVPTAAANAPTTTPSFSSGDYVLANTSVTFNAKAANTGYTWKGWYSNNTGTGNALSTNLAYIRSITATTNIYAVYTTNTYTVEFDANGGTGTMSNQNFTYGTAQNLTANAFTRTGYTFAGWATSENGNKVYNDKQSVSNLSSTNGATVTLYAKWDIINYTIKYNTNGGNSIADKTYTIETETFDLPTPTKDGCTFVGWYDNEGLTGDKVTQIAKGSYGDKTFYAKWDAEKFTLIWDANGGTITTPGSPEGGEVEAGTPLTPPTVTKDHYDHTGWTPEEPTVMPGEDITYIAQWTPKEYTITYDLNGGNGTMTPTTYTIESETFALPDNPTKAGHTFAGWYANAELTGNAVTQIEKGSTGDKAYWAKWEVASYTINFDTEGGTGVTTPLTVQYGAQLPNITIPTKAGYLFLGYYNGDNGTGTQYYDASGKGLKTMPANNLTLHAKWLNGSDCIFFYNNLGWSNVYVYFYSSDKYWDDSKGTGSKKEQIFPQEGDADHKPHYYEYRGKMTKIEGTNIWYYNYSVHSDIKIYNYTSVAFTKDQQYNYEFFHKTEVVRRGDFNSNVPMFVSMKADKVTKNESSYYNYGYWMNYPTNTGYTLKIYNKVKGDGVQEWRSIPFEYSEDMMMPLTLSVSGMEGGKTYGFKILRADNTWYGNSGTMTTNSSGDVGQTAWEFTKEVNDNCGLTTTAAGTYVFTLKYGKDRNSNYNYLVGVEYPASVGDYRLAYKDNTHPFHPGHLLKKRDGKDTVSFFVHHAQDLSPVIMLQEVTKIDAQTGDITWNTISTTEINGIGATGIYNFILEQSGNAATLLNTITEYTGDFYIRTDATAGGWGNFRQNSNKMTYTSYAENQGFGFNHYFVEWINAGTNVKFTIANEYSYCLSDSLNADGIVTDGNLPANANVRFGWNSKTNELTRAYISGSSNAADRYLVLKGDDKLTDMDDKNFDIADLDPNEAIFKDMGNWIYQLDAKAGRGASIQLTARYNEKDQTFFNTSAVALAEEGNETTYPVRFIYDFKTNNLMAAWLLEKDKNDIQGGNELNANMLLLRKHHDQAQQIQLSSTLRSVGTAYGVMTFEEDFVNDTEKSIYERALYWVSFPFDVCIRDVFGFGEYMDTWIMEYYNGEARAKNGAWVDSESYWTYITDLDYVLKAGVGYVLCLDLDKMGADSKVFENTSEVSLYFPSATPIGDIDVNQAVSDTLTELPCSIERDDRNIYDSNWHVIGVPRFINLNITLDGGKIDQQNVVYYYQYNASDNTYQAAVNSGKQTFQTMQAYMVQYAGIIDWWEEAKWETPQQIAARRNADAGPEKVSLNLELAQDDLTADKTFIQLQEEGATSDFDMNIDLTKIINAGANIYTLVGEGNIQTAGNVLPMGECEVPVGVKVEAAGEYTFRMPDGTEGMVVELIDYYTNTRTNLLLFDYTVDLSAGTCNDRFALHIQPSKSGVTTGIEGANPQPLPEGKGTKFLIDGKLIIRTAEGEVFDAQGKRL